MQQTVRNMYELQAVTQYWNSEHVWVVFAKTVGNLFDINFNTYEVAQNWLLFILVDVDPCCNIYHFLRSSYLKTMIVGNLNGLFLFIGTKVWYVYCHILEM